MRTLRLKHEDSRIFRAGTATIVVSEYSLDKDRSVCLTHECRTFEAVKAEVERLKGELDQVLEQAARRFEAE